MCGRRARHSLLAPSRSRQRLPTARCPDPSRGRPSTSRRRRSQSRTGSARADHDARAVAPRRRRRTHVPGAREVRSRSARSDMSHGRRELHSGSRLTPATDARAGAPRRPRRSHVHQRRLRIGSSLPRRHARTPPPSTSGIRSHPERASRRPPHTARNAACALAQRPAESTPSEHCRTTLSTSGALCHAPPPSHKNTPGAARL